MCLRNDITMPLEEYLYLVEENKSLKKKLSHWQELAFQMEKKYRNFHEKYFDLFYSIHDVMRISMFEKDDI
jgi:hypothetical protein